MAERRPTDEFCKPHEYLVQRNNTWFIVDVYGRLRIHDGEYPPELRHTPPQQSPWDIPLTIAAIIFFPFTLIYMLFQDDPNRKLKARQAWEKATYRDAGIYQPILYTWDGTGGMSGGNIASPDPTWGV